MFCKFVEGTETLNILRAFTEPFVEIQNISVNKLESKMNNASLARKILLFLEGKRPKHKYTDYQQTQLNKYLMQINGFNAVMKCIMNVHIFMKTTLFLRRTVKSL